MRNRAARILPVTIRTLYQETKQKHKITIWTASSPSCRHLYCCLTVEYRFACMKYDYKPMLTGSLVITAELVPKVCLWMRRPSNTEDSSDYIVYAVADSHQRDWPCSLCVGRAARNCYPEEHACHTSLMVCVFARACVRESKIYYYQFLVVKSRHP
jgi:hypothetical protein